jgi:hypothetical protein
MLLCPEASFLNAWSAQGFLIVGDICKGFVSPSFQASHPRIDQLQIGTDVVGDPDFIKHAISDESSLCHPFPVGTGSRGRSGSDAVTATTSRRQPRKHGKRAGLTCDHVGCSYEGTFRRQWELQRHIAAKHTSEKPFWCPVVGCIKGGGAPAFARPDKLTAHIRAVHYRGSAHAVCPAATCADTALELDLMGVHVNLQHLESRSRHEGVIRGSLRAIANAASSDHRHCLLWFCKVRVKLEDFPSHLLAHKSEELDAAANELVEEGYILIKFGCQHGEGNR